MNKQTKGILIILLGILLALSLFACSPAEPAGNPADSSGENELDPIWGNAIHREDATVGEGSKTVTVEVEAKGHRVLLTIRTDAATLGEALYALELINDPSFFDTANGIKADWNADSAYWAYFQGDQYMSVGVNDTAISGGEHYRLVYTQ